MDRSNSRIAILSGMFTSIGLAPHLIFLFALFLGGMPHPLGFLIPTYLAPIIFSEYLFYEKMVQNTSFVEWLKCALHPTNPGYVFWAYVSEISFDGLFLYLAVKFQWDPLHFFLILFGCKFLAAPIQTYLSSIFLSKNAGFALAVTTQILLFEICRSNPALFLYALIAKGILCNGMTVARSQYTSERGSQDVES